MCSQQNNERVIHQQTEHIFKLQGEIRQYQMLFLKDSKKPNHAQITAEINSRQSKKSGIGWYTFVFLLGFTAGVLSYGF